jgi:DNA phosphorothioation-dependent restriction protein DptG
LNIYCNKKLPLDGDDGGLKRRMRVVDYVSKFEDKKYVDEKSNIYEIDVHLSEKIKHWRADYMRMLLDVYNFNYVYSCPKVIDSASMEYMDCNNDVKSFVLEKLERSSNPKDYIQLSMLKSGYKSCKEYEQRKLKDLKRLLEIELQTTCKPRHGAKHVRNVFLGWKYVDDEEDEDGDENIN